jgi:uncharacterized membrane protein
MQTLFVVLHVVAAVFIVGPMAILPMTGLRAIRAGQPAQAKTLARSTFVTSLLSLLVVFFGFAALGTSDPKDHFSIATPWIWVSLLAYLIALALILFLVVPALNKAAGRLQTSDAETSSVPSASSDGGYGAIAAGSGIASLLLVLIVVLMVWKP